ncbi:MAG: PilN domain-containing protein [Gemmatimonadales bacterium]
MITINLRPGAKRFSTGSPLAGLGESFRSLSTKVKDPALAAAIAVSVLVLGLLIWGFLSTTLQTNRLTPQLDEVRAENQRFRTLLAQIRREERIRDSVVTELVTLRQVDRDRYVWPHILEEVSRALPPATWLIGVAPVTGASGGVNIDEDGNLVSPPLQIEMNGRAMDIQGFTRFMRQLEDSPWLQNVTAISANTLVESNRAVTAFVVRADFRQADPVYTRQVPVSEAVVAVPGGEQP